ncbi:MAG: hypothetical protein CVV39_08730, partial [Planctomycetes bacterium HGW-Planctomycetes-1]
MKIKKKILIVNCYFDEFRLPIRRKTKVPQAMTPAYLAGAFSPELCDIKLYNEQYSGPLESDALLSWPDMLVLTGLNTAFDRMLHLTAYARTKNRHVIVVAGGPAIRALPIYSQAFFDICCSGDVEQLCEVISETFGKDYVSRDFLDKGWLIPRYDMAYWMTWIGYVESSRNCYCNCKFCSLTAEGSKYQHYDLEYLRMQFKALGKRRVVIFLDNNFNCPNQQLFEQKIELIKELRSKKQFDHWCALVSGDFFNNGESINKIKNTGCLSLFSGVETFDKQALINFNKFQNAIQPQNNVIRNCLNAGIAFYYGLVFDVASRSISDLKDELDIIVNDPEITLPSYISLSVPILKTPFFYECLENNLILPHIRIRDLNSSTITLQPLDSMPDVVQFVKDIQTMSIFRKNIIPHSFQFYRRYRKKLAAFHMGLALYNAL